MATPEFNTVLFKVLFYAYECLKTGVEPNIAKAGELADVKGVRTFSWTTRPYSPGPFCTRSDSASPVSA